MHYIAVKVHIFSHKKSTHFCSVGDALTDRDVNETRSGRGRSQEHEAEANSHKAKAKIALMFFSQFLHFDPIFSKTKFSVDFRRNFTNFGS